MTIPAYSGEGDHRALTFREQSVEIASLPEGTEFYLADAQESPLAVTTKNAAMKSRTALHPFGHVRFQWGNTGDPWGFVGNEEDRGSCISDFHARPYRPELGAFLAVDPVALLSPEQTVGNPARLFAYAYAGGDPITQADANGLTFGQFVQGMWDQGVENVKATAKATVASVRSNAALAMKGDIGGAASNIVRGAAEGMVRTVKDVGNFGDDFAKAVFAPNDYEAGRLAVKPVMTAMTMTAGVMGTRLAVGKSAEIRSLGRPSNSVGFHATHPDAAASILKGGFRPGTKPGRLGSGGVYVNNSPAGAIAEFSYHNPGVPPAVLRVEYNPGTNAAAARAPKNYVTNHPLNVDSISAPSLRAPGSINTNVLNGSARPVGVVE